MLLRERNSRGTNTSAWISREGTSRHGTHVSVLDGEPDREGFLERLPHVCCPHRNAYCTFCTLRSVRIDVGSELETLGTHLVSELLALILDPRSGSGEECRTASVKGVRIRD